MQRSNVFLALAVLVVLLTIIFAGPALLDAWRGPPQKPAETADSPALEAEETTTLDAEAAAEVERVSSMLMLYQACANRFDGFDAEHRDVMSAWKAHHAEVFERPGAEPDFHIVLAEPEEPPPGENADSEERGLCERNVDAMGAELPEKEPAE